MNSAGGIGQQVFLKGVENILGIEQFDNTCMYALLGI